ncbi:MAG: class I adenylate cyclase, partial [Desulfovibrionaceae bacterium]
HFLLVHGYGLHTTSPDLLVAAHCGRRERLVTNQPARPPATIPPWADSEPTSDMVQLLVDHWFPKEDAALREGLYAAYSRRRIEMALEPQPPPARELWTLLPLILQTGPPGEAGESRQEPQLDIDGYQPDFACWEILQKQYEILDLPEPAKNALPVAGLYAMGQLGSMAQPGGYEFDLLLLLEDEKVRKKTIAALRKRLDAVQAFARKHYGVQLQFTVATPDSVRSGDFCHPAWKELTPGQAALNKEQLSRTLLPLHGKTPMWWLTPPELGEKDHLECQEQIAALPFFFAERTVDLGFPLKVTPQAFFGACLFELADAFSNPFFCLMRYAMIRRYITQRFVAEVFVFDKIKRRVFAGSKDLDEVDPWAALFCEVFAFLIKAGDPKGAELTGLAFALQSGAREQEPALDQAWTGHKSRFIQDFFSRDEKHKDILKHCRAAQSSFDYMTRSGKVFGAFLHSAVKALADQVARDESVLDIEPQHLELLVRKMDVLFSRRANKVDRIPFLRSVNRRFHHVILFSEKSPGRPAVWIMRGVPAELKVKKENLVDVCRDDDLARLLLWFTINGLYDPDCRFDADYSAAPLKPKDIRKLLLHMDAFFVRSQAMQTNLLLMAKPEAVLRALFILNLTTKRDVNQIFESSTAYSTSWGEVFCQTESVFGNKLRDEPKAFLKKISPFPVFPAVEMSSFMSEKSRCPDVNLPSRPNVKEQKPAAP